MAFTGRCSFAWLDSAGTYRVGDGEAARRRTAAFEPLKQLAGHGGSRQGAPGARPIKRIRPENSWPNLMIIAGQCCVDVRWALQDVRFRRRARRSLGARRRHYWGPEGNGLADAASITSGERAPICHAVRSDAGTDVVFV